MKKQLIAGLFAAISVVSLSACQSGSQVVPADESVGRAVCFNGVSLNSTNGVFVGYEYMCFRIEHFTKDLLALLEENPQPGSEGDFAYLENISLVVYNGAVINVDFLLHREDLPEGLNVALKKWYMTNRKD